MCKILGTASGYVLYNTHSKRLYFNTAKVPKKNYVIFNAISWIPMWSLLCKEDDRAPVIFGCKQWEMVSWDLFNRFG